MKKVLLAGTVCIFLFTSMIAVSETNTAHTTKKEVVNNSINNSLAVNYWIDSLYNTMNLSATCLSRSVFYTACKGYEYLVSQNKLLKQGLLTICDYSQSSDKKRLFVLDINEGKILFNTYVAHGRNSGKDYAKSFSNSDESHKTSLGFMVTAETYNGDNGYSMRLDGMENGFNNNVRSRAIVMHGSDYVNAQRVSSGEMMGRSFGCPAVPASEVKDIINSIKGGSCFFSYYPDKYYTKASKILNADFTWPVVETMQLAFVKIPDSLKKLSLTEMPVN